MDNQEAKFLLRAYRPGGADAGDPAFAEALEQARRDPEIAKWLEHEQALDRVVAKKLQSINPPRGLRETILAGGRVSHTRTSAWYRSSWIGLAASVVILLGLGLGWIRVQTRAEADRISTWAINDVLHGTHGSHGEASGRLQAAVSDPMLRLAGASLPIDLEKLNSTGCRVLTFAGREVMEVCFVRSGKEYHLYVMAGKGELPRAPRVIERDGGSAAAWSDERLTYVVATTSGTAALRGLL